MFVGVQGFMISSFSEQKDLAKSFVLDFMSQEPTQLALFEAGGRPPALTSAFDQVTVGSRRRRLRRVRRRGHPAAGDPGDEQRLERRSASPRSTCSAAPIRPRSSPPRPSRSAPRSAADAVTERGCRCSTTGRAPAPARPAAAAGRVRRPRHGVGVDRQDRPARRSSTPSPITGLLIAVDNRRRGATSPCSAVTLVALNVVYLPRRYVPMKYLLPGLFFLAVFGVYPVLYTAYASTTNYGTGFVLSRGRRRSTRSRASRSAASRAPTAYDVTPLRGPDGAFAGFGLFDPETERALPRHDRRARARSTQPSPSCRC